MIFLLSGTNYAQSDDALTVILRANPTAVSLDGQTRIQLALSADSISCPTTVNTTALDVLLVLDRSGSMDGSPWGSAQSAAVDFIGQMNPAQDRVGVVFFSGSASLEQSLTNDMGSAQAAINRGSPSGGTDIADGLERGGDELVRNGRSDNTAHVLILLSDGDSSRSAAIRNAETYKDAGIRIITIGLGSDVEESLLRDIASNPVTDYYPAPSPDELGAIYQSIAESIQQSVGVTNIEVNHTFDDTNFELVPDSISSFGTLSGNTITWELATLPDNDLALFSYQLRPLQSGTFNASQSTSITFQQCEAENRTINLDPGPEIFVPEPPPPPVVTPGIITGETCEEGCVEQIIRVEIPTVDNPLVVNQLDVLFLMDVSSSMGDELNVVKQESTRIMEGLRDMVADTNFGMATFVDYPGFYDSSYGGPYGDTDDYSWQLDQDMTSDIGVVSRAITRVGLLNGKDGPEAYTRALYETQFLGWRPEARRIVILFGDAVPHDRTFFSEDYGIDPGRDGRENTDDDLQLRQVIAELSAANISVIAVNTSDSEEAVVTQFFRYLAEETDGQYFRLGTAEQIPESIQTLVGGQIASISQIGISANMPYQTWLEVSPPNYTNISYDGRVLEYRVRICPHKGNTNRGDYTFDLGMTVDEEIVASIPTSITFRPICLPQVDLFVADHLDDDGTDCSNLTGQPFWESPDIVIRHQDDNGRESQIPQPGEPNHIYVQVRNRGYQETSDANIHLYWTYSGLIQPSDMGWYDLGEMEMVIPGEGQTWTPGFTWIPPDTGPFAFLIRVESVNDPVTKPDDIACENNLALNNAPTFALSMPSMYSGSLGGQLSLPLTGDGLADLIVDLAGLPADATLSLTLDRNAFSGWAGNVEGGIVDGSQIIASHGSTLILRDLPLTTDTPKHIVWLVTSATEESVSIPIRLRSNGEDIAGITVTGQQTQPLVLGPIPELTPVPIVQANNPPLNYIVPFAFLAIMLSGMLAWVLFKR